MAILCRIDSVDQLRFAGLPRCGGCVLGVASRGWACARRDRLGGGAFALTRDGDWVAAIRCSLRPSPAAAGVWSGCGWFVAGDRGLGLLGGLLGVASRDWACARRDRSGGDGFRADARWGLGGCDPMLATAQSRCRRCVVGVWSGCGWVLIGEGLIVNGDLGSGAVVGELQDCFRGALTRVGGLRSFCAHVRVA